MAGGVQQYVKPLVMLLIICFVFNICIYVGVYFNSELNPTDYEPENLNETDYDTQHSATHSILDIGQDLHDIYNFLTGWLNNDNPTQISLFYLPVIGLTAFNYFPYPLSVIIGFITILIDILIVFYIGLITYEAINPLD